MDLETYKKTYSTESSESAVGWDAIASHLKTLYPTQEPMHWGTIVSWNLGGHDPLDGISAYQADDPGGGHFHYVTYGLSNLYYDEEAVGGEYSAFGFELTFRLRPFAKDGKEPPTWVCDLFQNLARYVFETQRVFDDLHWIPANGPIRLDTKTEIVGLAFLTDPALGVIETPHGKVQFLQMVGLTQSEIDAIKSKKKTVAEVLDSLTAQSPLLITDLTRSSKKKA